MLQMNPIRLDAAATPMGRHRILIIDDNSFFSFCLRTLIDREEELAVCDVAASEEDLLERIERYSPDLLVVDLSVGRQGGYDLACSLRRSGIRTPILFVSIANPLPQSRLEQIPGAEFACKGGNPRLLIARIKALLDRAGGAPTWSEGIAAIA